MMLDVLTVPDAGVGGRTIHETWIVMNQRHPEVRRDLRDLVGMHRRIMSMFPQGLGADPRAAVAALHRVEGDGLLLRSAVRPDTDALPDGYAIDVGETVVDVPVAGERVVYRVLVNPTTAGLGERGPDGRRSRGVRRPVAAEGMPDWWAARAEKHGLRIGATKFTRGPILKTSGKGTHGTFLVEGSAVVVDAAALQEALVHGIGRGKNYGCGLLTTRPARPSQNDNGPASHA